MRKVGHAKNCTWNLNDYICRKFDHTNHLLNVSLIGKTDNDRHTVHGYRKKSKSHFMLQQVGHFYHVNIQAKIPVYDKTN